ncbi:MAG: leucine-rich repeat domain-containing protein [Pseudobdellovibrionaceae bacterium]
MNSIVRSVGVFLFILLSADISKADICQRSKPVVVHFEKLFKKSCTEITSSDLSTITEGLGFGGAAIKVGDLDGLTNLSLLILFDMDLGTVSPELFRDLQKLGSLSLRDMKSLDLPDGVFSKLVGLQQLTISNSTLTLGPKVFHEHQNLQRFTLMELKLTQSLPSPLFSDCPSLESVFFEGLEESSGFITLPEHLFEESNELKKLVISNTDLNSVPPNLLRNLDKLEQFSIGGGYEKLFLPVDFFSGLNKLESIRMWSVVLKSQSLRSLNGLTVFECSHGCDLSDFRTGEFSDLSQLQHLNLSENGKSHYFGADYYKGKMPHLTPGFFHGLDNLTFLDLGTADLKSLNRNQLAGLQNLKSLVLTDNGLSDFPKDIFKDLQKLKSVSLLWNPISSAKIKVLRREYPSVEFRGVD